MRHRLLALIGCAAVVGAMTMGTAAASPPGHSTGAATPTVTPLTGGAGVPVLASTTTFDLGQFGYEEAEYQLQGTASAYSSAAPLGTDGRWTVTPTAPAPYTTRAVVYRPARAQDFNGTVIVEWLNVSGGVDASPDWGLSHVELMREGYAYMAVSAQQLGLEATRAADPVRYAALTHPGDSYSYDIYSQAGQAVRARADVLLGRLHPRKVIAIGESQSASRMVTYIDAVHPLARVYDGFLVHSRSAAGSALSQPPLTAAAVTPPNGTRIRDDVGVPVLVFETETDIGGLQARQPDSRTYRLWEVAGTSHFDAYGLGPAATDTGDLAGTTAWFNLMRTPPTPPGFGCSGPINTGPATYVLRSAVAALDEWVTRGRAPASAPRFQVVDIASTTAPYAVDSNGNVQGGIRTPAVDAPVARLTGLGQPIDQGFCRLFGTTTPFTPAQLTAMYHNRAGFLAAWSRATWEAVRGGYVRPEDAGLLVAAAARSGIPA